VEERINVPGTVADTNWSYRTPFKIEEFGAHEPLKKKIRALLKDRHSLIPPRRASRQ
jgi:4-alpha-glucanotransferase